MASPHTYTQTLCILKKKVSQHTIIGSKNERNGIIHQYTPDILCVFLFSEAINYLLPEAIHQIFI